MKTFLFVSLIVLIAHFVTAIDPVAELETARTRHVRQAMPCTDSSDCLPAALGNVTVPNDLVSCQGSACVCRMCFELNPTSGICEQPNACWTYNSGTRSCDDRRKSQLIAFLLSFFLSYVGAANFYIERGDLAGGQLAAFLVIFLFSYVVFIPCCFICCCKDSESGLACGAIAFGIIIAIGTILMLAASLIMLAWWIADLVIFVENTRVDGMGCALSPTLTGTS